MHFYEKNIVEIKNEYTGFLINIMTPLVYEGIKGMYAKSRDFEKKVIEAAKKDPKVINEGILKIFQAMLNGIPNLNSYAIQEEKERIKNGSKCAEWFDDLVRAVIKSNIVLLTFNATEKKCKLVNEKFHETVDIDLFIHKCYIECARGFYDYPELFWHEFSTIEIKRNKRDAFELIKQCINDAIRKMLPIKPILEEYLKNDYIQDDEEVISDEMQDAKYKNIHGAINKDLKNSNGSSYIGNMDGLEIFESDDDEENEQNGENIGAIEADKNINENLINTGEQEGELNKPIEQIKSEQVEAGPKSNETYITSPRVPAGNKETTKRFIENLVIDKKSNPSPVKPAPIKQDEAVTKSQMTAGKPNEPNKGIFKKAEVKPAGDVNIKIDSKNNTSLDNTAYFNKLIE